MRAVYLLIALAVLLAGCGYKGPLTLPKPKTEARKPAPAPATQPEEKKPDAS
jgi:predicted small lipoprotein YifL